MAFVNVKPRAGLQNHNQPLFADSRMRTFLLWLLLVIPTITVYYPVHSHPFSKY